MVSDNQSLDGLCNDEALLALSTHKNIWIRLAVWGADSHVLLPVHLEAIGKHLTRAGKGFDDNFHLIRRDLEVCRVCPVIIAILAKNGGAVNETSADEAGVDVSLPRHFRVCGNRDYAQKR